jgi:hypothetical protein
MKALDRLRTRIFGFGCAVIFAPMARMGYIFSASVQKHTVDSLLLGHRLVAEGGGFGPALVARLIASGGVYRLFLVLGQDGFYNPTAWIQTPAFFVTAFFISYMVLQRKRALSSLQASELHYRRVTETSPDSS